MKILSFKYINGFSYFRIIDHPNQFQYSALIKKTQLSKYASIFRNFDKSKVDDILKKYPMPYIEVSARTGQNINELFPTAITQVLKEANNNTINNRSR